MLNGIPESRPPSSVEAQNANTPMSDALRNTIQSKYLSNLSFKHHIFINLHWQTWGDLGEHFRQSFFFMICCSRGQDWDRKFHEWRDEDCERSQHDIERMSISTGNGWKSEMRHIRNGYGNTRTSSTSTSGSSHSFLLFL